MLDLGCISLYGYATNILIPIQYIFLELIYPSDIHQQQNKVGNKRHFEEILMVLEDNPRTWLIFPLTSSQDYIHVIEGH